MDNYILFGAAAVVILMWVGLNFAAATGGSRVFALTRQGLSVTLSGTFEAIVFLTNYFLCAASLGRFWHKSFLAEDPFLKVFYSAMEVAGPHVMALVIVGGSFVAASLASATFFRIVGLAQQRPLPVYDLVLEIAPALLAILGGYWVIVRVDTALLVFQTLVWFYSSKLTATTFSPGDLLDVPHMAQKFSGTFGIQLVHGLSWAYPIIIYMSTFCFKLAALQFQNTCGQIAGEMDQRRQTRRQAQRQRAQRRQAAATGTTPPVASPPVASPPVAQSPVPRPAAPQANPPRQPATAIRMVGPAGTDDDLAGIQPGRSMAAASVNGHGNNGNGSNGHGGNGHSPTSSAVPQQATQVANNGHGQGDLHGSDLHDDVQQLHEQMSRMHDIIAAIPAGDPVRAEPEARNGHDANPADPDIEQRVAQGVGTAVDAAAAANQDRISDLEQRLQAAQDANRRDAAILGSRRSRRGGGLVTSNAPQEEATP